jgi:sulfonate transport system substrate-binding protein
VKYVPRMEEGSSIMTHVRNPLPSPAAMSLSRRSLLRGAVAVSAGFAFASGRPAAAAVPAGTVLKVGDQKGGSQAVMEAAGVLKDLPYRIEWSQFPAAAPLLEALNAGAIESGFAGDAPTTFALAAGTPARIIAANRSNPQGTAIVVSQGSAIRTVADLKGKTIGTGHGSVGHYLVLSALKANGLAPDDVKLAFLLPAEAKSALAAGAVDAWSTWGIFVSQAVLKEEARIVVDGGNGLLSGLSYQTATVSAIAEKREALEDLVSRLATARRWALDNIDGYSQIWARIVGIDPAIAKYTFEVERARPVAIDPSVLADQQVTADLWTGSGVLTKKLDVASFFDPSFNAALRV